MEIYCRQFHSPSDYQLIMIFDELHKQITGIKFVFVCMSAWHHNHIKYLFSLRVRAMPNKETLKKEKRVQKMSKNLPSTINYNEKYSYISRSHSSLSHE